METREEALARIKARRMEAPLSTEGLHAVDPIHKKYEDEMLLAADKEEAKLKAPNPLVALASTGAALAMMPPREPVRPRMFGLSDAERKHKQKAKLKRRQEKASRRRNRG